jgi:hypothetical protein
MVKRCLDLLGGGIIDTSMLATPIIKYGEYEMGIRMARERPEGFVKAMFVNG